MAFTERQILHFPIYHFKNRAPSKSKYMLVLKKKSGDSLLISLPSSVDNVPLDLEGKYGCLDYPDRFFNCFLIEPNCAITEGDTFQFPRPTHLYGEYLGFLEKQDLQKYPVEGIDYQIKGMINQNLYDDILNCFKNSKTVANKFKRIL
jgi:hypothetical protein